MKKSELKNIIKEELDSILNEGYKERDNTFFLSGDEGLRYQIPYILPGEREKLPFDPDVMRAIRRGDGSSDVYKLVRLYNDKMNAIVEKAENDIKKLGQACAKEIIKNKKKYYKEI